MYSHTFPNKQHQNLCPGSLVRVVWCGYFTGAPLDPSVRISLGKVFSTTWETPDFVSGLSSCQKSTAGLEPFFHNLENMIEVCFSLCLAGWGGALVVGAAPWTSSWCKDGGFYLWCHLTHGQGLLLGMMQGWELSSVVLVSPFQIRLSLLCPHLMTQVAPGKV